LIFSFSVRIKLRAGIWPHVTLLTFKICRYERNPYQGACAKVNAHHQRRRLDSVRGPPLCTCRAERTVPPRDLRSRVPRQQCLPAQPRRFCPCRFLQPALVLRFPCFSHPIAISDCSAWRGLLWRIDAYFLGPLAPISIRI
jgi:hypothetical protein